MSIQTSRIPMLSVTRGLICGVMCSLVWTGCSRDSSDPVAEVQLAPPLLNAFPGQLNGNPTVRPYLTDLHDVAAKPIMMRFRDGILVVQKSGEPKVELIPTPNPDRKGAGPGPAAAPSSGDAATKDRPGSPQRAVIGAQQVGGPEDYKTWDVPEVVLVVTGRQHGYIEPCGCTGLDRQKGGMARRFTFMKELKQQGWPLVPIDGGDQVRRVGPQAEIKLQETTRALKQMEYQAVGFGPDDLRLGVGELLSVAAAEDLDNSLYVSANVVLIDPDLMPQAKVVDQNGYRIGLTSILDPSAMEVELGDDVTIGPILPAAQNAIAQMAQQRASFKVMLFFGEEEAAKKLAVDVPGYDLVVVTGGYGEPTFRPLSIDGSNTKMIVTGDKGMYAGLVGLYRDQPLKYARVALTHEFADAPEMRKLMAEYQDQLKAIGLEGLGLLSPVPHASGQQFIGTAKCGDCHTQAMDVWENSPHAEATNDIVRPTEGRGDVPRHFDPECLSCHVTGWNPQEYFPYESGYRSLEKSKHLTGSGCENCHGPGSKHAAAEADGSTVTAEVREELRQSMRLPLAKAREKCITCHDLDNSPDFHDEGAFEDVYWPEVEHAGMD